MKQIYGGLIMKKIMKKKTAVTRSKKATPQKKKVNKKIVMAKSTESPVHNTEGAKMPNPGARNRPPRKDIRFAFR